jgi:hypothetical protein
MSDGKQRTFRPERPEKKARDLGPNEKVIRDLMKIKKYRGNPKDYVVLAGDNVMDVDGSVPVKRKTEQGRDKVLLLHKKDLHKIIDDAQAARFWNRKLRVRVPRRRATKPLPKPGPQKKGGARGDR